MHRRLQLAGADSLADFGDEGAALAAMRQQLAGLIGIARRFELDDLDVDAGRDRRSERRAMSSVWASAMALLRVPIRSRIKLMPARIKTMA